MTDYLDTVVESCKIKYDITQINLKAGALERTELVLPLSLSLVPGDKIEFYHGSYSEPLSHSDYIRATVYRDNKEIISLNARDMRILTEIREAEQK